MNIADDVALVLGAAHIISLIEQANYAEAAKAAAELGLDLVPVDEFKGYLTDAAAKRAEIAANVAEDLKVAPELP